MRTAVGLFAVISMTGACGAESWSFDHDAGSKDVEGPEIDASTADQSAVAAPDVFDGGVIPEAGLVSEMGPVPEAAQGCSLNSDCPIEAPLCSQAAGVCIRCSSEVDCPSDAGTPACNATSGACVQCTSNSACSGALPYCDTTSDLCVQCLTTAQCGFESLCQLATHTCTKMF